MYFMLLVDVKVRVDLEDVKEGKKKCLEFCLVTHVIA